MTELFIDGQPVILPKNFSIKVIHENPFIKKNGEYTYDLTLSLLNPINAKVYKHIDRANNNVKITKRNAILVSDNIVFLNGTEIILDHSDTDVKIQLASGNSELNYIAGLDKKIRDLDLGTVDINIDKARQSLLGDYRQFKYCCPGIFFGSDDTIIEHRANYWNLFTNPLEASLMPGNTHGVIAQPYLMYYIEKIPEALGYKIAFNALLENDLFCKIYIANPVFESLRFCDLLPDWTVLEFIEEVEKFFNVIFLVNQGDKTVSIHHPYNYLSSAAETYIDSHDILDKYNCSSEENEELYFTTKNNFRYAFSNNDYFKRVSIPKEVFEKAYIINYDTLQKLYEDLKANESKFKSQYFQTMAIFYAKDVDSYYILMESITSDVNNNKISYMILAPINIFCDVDSGEENTVEFKITPVRIFPSHPGGSNAGFPYISVPEPPEELDYNTDFGDLILDGVPDTDKSSKAKNIEIAIYYGVHSILKIIGWDRYPQDNFKNVWVFTDYLPPVNYENPYHFPNFYFIEKRDASNYTLRLTGEYSILKETHQRVENIDLSESWNFKFLFKNVLNVRNIFNIQHKKFLCKQLEYDITSKGVSPVVNGEFFPFI